MLAARDQLKKLFRNEELLLWGVCYPVPRPPGSTQPPPLSAGTYCFRAHDRLTGHFRTAVKEIVAYVGAGVDVIFSSPEMLHNSEFWKTHFWVLWFELTAGLSVCRGERSEAEIRHYLLTPLLKRTAHAASMTLAPDECNCIEYCSYLGFETKTTESTRRGRK